MLILALDLGRRTAIASGEAGSIPRVGAKALARPGEGPEEAAGELARWLRDEFVLGLPDLLAVEHWLHPSAQPSGDVVIMQMHLHGALRGIVGCYGVSVVMPTPDEVRRHFCGRASAMGRSRPGAPRDARQRAAARQATKDMVIDRAVLLGYLPKTVRDDDKADACALFDWASATHARRPVAGLRLYGERVA